MARDQKHVQAPLLHPATRRPAALLPQLREERVARRVQHVLQRLLALLAHRNVFSDVQEYIRLDKRLGLTHRVREVGEVECRGCGGCCCWCGRQLAPWCTGGRCLRRLTRREKSQLDDEGLQES